MIMLKISFDFDGTLEFEDVQDVARKLIAEGHFVCILTTRYSDVSSYCFEASHADLYGVANKLGIKDIYFTEYQWKSEHVDKYNIDIHVDDNYEDEVRLINGKCKAKAVLFDEWDKGRPNNGKLELAIRKVIKEIEDASVAKS